MRFELRQQIMQSMTDINFDPGVLGFGDQSNKVFGGTVERRNLHLQKT